MNKTKIEWVRGPNGELGYSWNPIKGLCPVGCWYCYARKMYKRFKWSPEISLNTPTGHWHVPDGSRVFVCSTMEMFHPRVPRRYRDYIFQEIGDYPKLTFIILTKMPELIDRPMPDNIWLGVSVTRMENISRISCLLDKKAKTKFISFEPLLDYPALPAHGIDWVIIGKLTGHGTKHDPPKRWIESLVDMARGLKYPVFLKNNLRDVWGPNLIQEFPR